MRAALLAVSLVALTAACSKSPDDDAPVTVNTAQFSSENKPGPVTVDPAAAAARDYAGRWTGVEGTYLSITRGTVAGTYMLEMQYDLDHKTTVTGQAVADTIVFTRDGKQLVLKPTNGDATGLKYLAGKADCLTVTSGEGYCRG